MTLETFKVIKIDRCAANAAMVPFPDVKSFDTVLLNHVFQNDVSNCNNYVAYSMDTAKVPNFVQSHNVD